MDHLTGNFYFKQSFLGLVLMVEYEVVQSMGADLKKWRKGKAKDLIHLKGKVL